MTKTRKNANKTRRSLPPCDYLHPVTVRFEYLEHINSYEDITFYDSDELFDYVYWYVTDCYDNGRPISCYALMSGNN